MMDHSVIKSGYMVKRSQNRRPYTIPNYKKRWFVLTKTHLIYYDLENATKRREKGRVHLEAVHSVENAFINLLREDKRVLPQGFECPFLVGYQFQGDDYVLHLVTGNEQERSAWVSKLREVCADNRNLRTKYHPGIWNGSRWGCCRYNVRNSLGCELSTLWLQTAGDGESNKENGLQEEAIKNACPPFRNGGAPLPPLPEEEEEERKPPIQYSVQHHHRRSACPIISRASIVPVLAVGGCPREGAECACPGDPERMRVFGGCRWAFWDSVVHGITGIQSSGNMPGGATPGTPSSKQKISIRPKIVVALYNHQAMEPGDLPLEKNEEYEVLDDSQEHWWKVKDSHGNVGLIPSNYVKEKELLGLQQYEWYVNDMSRHRSEQLLKQEDKEGCFVVRNSSTKGMYTLSLYTKTPHPHVKHYHIKQNPRGEFYLSEKHCCNSIPDLINYHKYNSGGLASRLRCSPCDRSVPATAGLSQGKWEIDHHELMLLEELGSGQFGVVRKGKWRGSIDVAVKMMKEGSMSEDDFIEEAKVMTKLQHVNLVQLYGVCSKNRPIFIVTEYMRYGSLLNYLRRHEQSLCNNQGLLLDMCIQVCNGMAYLERHNYIHRDLAARNCLVGNENVVKVADFGLARYVLDDQYTSSGGAKFPIKWAPPEVLNFTRFSSKSDVWAYGVLMWEVFTCGKMPYGRMKNTEVVEKVQKGIISLERPKGCDKEIYDIMCKCWSRHPEGRPSFRHLKELLLTVSQKLLID